MKRLSLALVFLSAMLLSLTPATTAAPPEMERYIVVLYDSAGPPAAAAEKIAASVGGQVGFIYVHALRGFSIQVPAQALAALERNPNVKYVETDNVRYAFAQTVPTGIKRIFADANTNLAIDGKDDYQDCLAQVQRLLSAARRQVTPRPDGGDAPARNQDGAIAKRRAGNPQDHPGAQEKVRVDSVMSRQRTTPRPRGEWRRQPMIHHHL